MIKLFKYLFSFNGRVSRFPLIISTLITIFMVAKLIHDWLIYTWPYFQASPQQLFIYRLMGYMLLPLLISHVSFLTRRMHDLNYSGRAIVLWIILLLLSFYSPVYIAFMLYLFVAPGKEKPSDNLIADDQYF